MQKLMRRLNLSRRFMLIAVLSLVMTSVPLYMYEHEANKMIDMTATELAGMPVVRAYLDFTRLMQKHRGIATAWISGTGTTAEQRDAVLKEITEVTARLEKIAANPATPAAVARPISEAMTEWQSLSAAVGAKSIEVAESRKRHGALIRAFLDGTETAADAYGLTLDPDAAPFHLVIGTTLYMPSVGDAMSSLRAVGADALGTKTSTPEERVASAVLVDRAQFLVKRADLSYTKAIAADVTVEKVLKESRETAAKELTAAVDLARTILVKDDRSMSAGDFRSRMNKAIDAQFKLSEQSLVETERLLGERLSALTTSFRMVLAFVIAVVALVVVLIVAISRSVVHPVGEALALAEDVASGKLDRVVTDEANDEVGRLSHAMKNMQSVLKGYLVAQEKMADEHDKGTISYRVDASQFPGSFGELAKKTNDLVATHIAVKMRVVEVVSEYAKGNLSVDMDRLPGEKAKITDAIDGVKASLMAVNGEIAKLVEAAADGDFSVRGDVAKFDHQFRKMVEDLNRLMNSADTGLTAVAKVLQRVAEGDFTRRVDGDLKGKFAELKDDTNKTVEQLARVIGQIREASDTINLASKEIAQGNADLSQRTEEQASSLEETASSMEEFTSTVKQNADNARQANQLAAGASEVAVKGGTVVREVVETMGGISESSRKIADIIGVIDGIAFQTNILALNAAVEAARAGEQGRGFAVVATEVRNLAQRSANAAKEIKGLIEDSVTRVDTGSKLVAQAGETIDEVVNSVKRVSDIISEITAASSEQSAGIEQVNSAVTQMDEVTQQNAALVEQAAAAAESLQEQAGALVQAVSVFRVSADEAAAFTPAAWDGRQERRGPDRAKNVARMAAKPAPVKVSAPKAEAKKVANSDDWQEF